VAAISGAARPTDCIGQLPLRFKGLKCGELGPSFMVGMFSPYYINVEGCMLGVGSLSQESFVLECIGYVDVFFGVYVVWYFPFINGLGYYVFIP
jgi:hypothetical protein